jgi:Sec-independent protein translocase protein TatA
MKIIVTILILYILYKLIFDFVVPVARTTSQFKSQVNQMRRMQEEQLRKQQEPQRPSQPSRSTSTVKNTTTTDGEYIDFEDIK